MLRPLATACHQLMAFCFCIFEMMVVGVGFEPTVALRGQIYSLLPLTTRPPHHHLNPSPLNRTDACRQQEKSVQRQTDNAKYINRMLYVNKESTNATEKDKKISRPKQSIEA